MLNPVPMREKSEGIHRLTNEVKIYYNLESLPESTSVNIGENVKNLKNDLKLSEIDSSMLNFEWNSPSLSESSVNQDIKKMQKIYEKLILNYKEKKLNEDSEVVKFRENYYQLLVYTRTIWFSLHLSSFNPV